MSVDTRQTSNRPVYQDDEQRYAWARERAEMLQGLYIHALVFVVVNAGLVTINWATMGGDGSWWVIWPLMTWGLGLAVHVIVTVFPVFSSRWVDDRAQRIADRM